jgi:threonine dehydratase
MPDQRAAGQKGRGRWLWRSNHVLRADARGEGKHNGGDQADTGATVVHPYNDERVIAGQGTAALELLAEAPDLDVIIAPVGGGGLLSGTSIAAKGLKPDIRVIAAEPEMADDAYRSMKEGRIIPSVNPKTIADGLLTSLGTLTFPIIQQNVEQIVTVSERGIIEAMKFVWERAKIVIEPSAAVAVACCGKRRSI